MSDVPKPPSGSRLTSLARWRSSAPGSTPGSSADTTTRPPCFPARSRGAPPALGGPPPRALLVLRAGGREPPLPYQVRLEGEQAWPPLSSDRPPSVIRTLGDRRALRVAFGSCRYGRAAVKLNDAH